MRMCVLVKGSIVKNQTKKQPWSLTSLGKVNVNVFIRNDLPSMY